MNQPAYEGNGSYKEGEEAYRTVSEFVLDEDRYREAYRGSAQQPLSVHFCCDVAIQLQQNIQDPRDGDEQHDVGGKVDGRIGVDFDKITEASEKKSTVGQNYEGIQEGLHFHAFRTFPGLQERIGQQIEQNKRNTQHHKPMAETADSAGDVYICHQSDADGSVECRYLHDARFQGIIKQCHGNGKISCI